MSHATAVPTGHTRLICASLARVSGSVMEELLAMRGQVRAFNQARGLRSAFLSSSGWFFEWYEGAAAAVEKALRVSRADSRHHNLRVLHRSLGDPVLTECLQIMATHGGEKPTDVARRLDSLQRGQVTESPAQPGQFWAQLAAPLRLPAGHSPGCSLVRRHIVVVASEHSESIDLVRSLADRFAARVTYQRFAAGTPGSADVGAAYVDLPGPGHTTRLHALSRRSLAYPLVRLCLGQLHGMVLLLGERAEHARALGREAVELLRALGGQPPLRLAGSESETTRAALDDLGGYGGEVVSIDRAALHRSGPDTLFDLILGPSPRDVDVMPA